ALAELGYSAKQVDSIRSAYEVAEILFTDHLEPVGPDLLAHHLGTAAQLARFAAPPAAITAGLLHGAGPRGRFPPEAGRSTVSQGEWLRLRIGDAAATIVAAAARIPFDASDNSCDGVDLDRLPIEVAFVAAIRVAAELDRRASGRPPALSE